MQQKVLWSFTMACLSLGSVSAKTASPDPFPQARAAAQSWLTLLDQKNFSENWRQASPLLKSRVSRMAWEMSRKSDRIYLGEFISRTFKSARYTQSVPDRPPGDYVVLEFKSVFKRHKAIETVIPIKEADGSWKVVDYDLTED